VAAVAQDVLGLAVPHRMPLTAAQEAEACVLLAELFRDSAANRPRDPVKGGDERPCHAVDNLAPDGGGHRCAGEAA
jgi:hypothetical protein